MGFPKSNILRFKNHAPSYSALRYYFNSFNVMNSYIYFNIVFVLTTKDFNVSILKICTNINFSFPFKMTRLSSKKNNTVLLKIIPTT